MKILLVAATQAECEPLLRLFEDTNRPAGLNLNNHETEILITGVGMVATAFALGRHLSLNRYDLVINLGIAGSFDFNLSIGEVVMITKDIFAELGAENGDEFLSLNELGFGDISQSANPGNAEAEPLQSSRLNLTALEELKRVKAITVNKVHGNEFTIAKTLSKYDAQVESMEGAAFFYACSQMQARCMQIRAISNYVERRNQEKWNIGLAIKNLNAFMVRFLIN